MSTITVNGRARPARPDLTVAELLREDGTERTGVAVAVDGALVHREQWATTVLRTDAVVEVLSPMQGG
ncbi:sulfur carrier protein ThiS [Luteipulveratus sp. YIM 133132]|uniref:sulfur carrier protein ThiS n=1 Tax=Luteipulveratus flavus TaxID=3031728 RepID=UPI0023B07579|nr:sulfur carrier protein ThiS [Luteipulveratus sp. YIM 133132]MDE9366528.1 sulfur carrier protein ThiS [Luteipulveratus sp. YIM 133132]